MTNKTATIIGQGHFLPFHVIMLLQADCIWNAVVIVHLFLVFSNIHSLYKITHIVDTMFKSVNTVSAYNKNLTTRVSTDWIIKNRLHLSGPSPKRGLQRWSRMWRMMHPCFRAQTLHFSFFASFRSSTESDKNRTKCYSNDAVPIYIWTKFPPLQKSSSHSISPKFTVTPRAVFKFTVVVVFFIFALSEMNRVKPVQNEPVSAVSEWPWFDGVQTSSHLDNIFSIFDSELMQWVLLKKVDSRPLTAWLISFPPSGTNAGDYGGCWDYFLKL